MVGSDDATTEHTLKGGEATTEASIDYFRDTPIRFVGYANEVGESFRHLIHVRYVRFSYFIGSSYCVLDALSKAVESKPKPDQIETGKSGARVAVETFVENLVWQGLASVVIPGFTINRICWLSTLFVQRGLRNVISVSKQKYLVTGIGLSSIPYIIKPIDMLVDHIVEKASRDYNLPSDSVPEPEFPDLPDVTQIPENLELEVEMEEP